MARAHQFPCVAAFRDFEAWQIGTLSSLESLAIACINLRYPLAIRNENRMAIAITYC